MYRYWYKHKYACVFRKSYSYSHSHITAACAAQRDALEHVDDAREAARVAAAELV